MHPYTVVQCFAPEGYLFDNTQFRGGGTFEDSPQINPTTHQTGCEGVAADVQGPLSVVFLTKVQLHGLPLIERKLVIDTVEGIVRGHLRAALPSEPSGQQAAAEDSLATVGQRDPPR